MLELVTVSLLNGVVYGLLLFMLSSGLTLIFSMMGVLNFAHASVFMLGAYLSFQFGRWVGFWPALVVAPLACALVGAAIERYGLRRVHAQRPRRRDPVHVRTRLRHRGDRHDDLGPQRRRQQRARGHRLSAFHRLRQHVSGVQGPDDGDLGRDVRLPLRRAQEDADRPRHPGGADASADGERAWPRRAGRIRAGVRRSAAGSRGWPA